MILKEYNTHPKDKTLCDKAINKYGKITEIEILEFVNDKDLLQERERYWISYYQTNNKEYGYNLTKSGDLSFQCGEKSPRAIFTDEQVLDIRKRRFSGELRRDVYKDYSDKSLATFGLVKDILMLDRNI